MSKTVKYNAPAEELVEELHPQVRRSELSDSMSKRSSVTISIPEWGGDLDAVLDLINSGFDDPTPHKLQSLEGVLALIEATVDRDVETDPDHPFTDESFRLRAVRRVEVALEALSGLELDQSSSDTVKNDVLTRAFEAGLLIGELRTRQEHLACVSNDRHRMQKLQEANRSTEGTTRDHVRKGLARMDELIAGGHNQLNAAMIATSEGYGTSVEANRSAYRRRVKAENPSQLNR